MGFELRLIQEQKMGLEQRSAMKLELSFKMTTNLEDVRDKVSGSPEELLEIVLRKALGRVENKNLKEGLENFLSDENLKNTMINNVGEIALCDQKRVYDFIIGYFYDKFGGNFTIADEETKKDKSIHVEKANFKEALINRNKLIEKRDEIHKLLKEGAVSNREEDFRGAIEEARGMDNALHVAEISDEQIKTLKQGMLYIMLLPDSEGRPLLADFLREYFVLSRLDVDLSERLQKRFIERFSKVNPKSKPEQFQSAFLNMIGEATLISMGILSPEIFARQKAERDKEFYNEVKENLAKSNIDIDKLLKDYNQKGYGTIFWNRWKVVGEKLSSITDDKIREFLTLTVRQDADRVMEIFNYQELFKSVQGINSAGGNNKEDRENHKMELREALINIFEDEKTQELWTKLIKEQWLDKLSIFMKPQQKSAVA